MFTKRLAMQRNAFALGQMRRHFGYTTLYANTNQAHGLAEYAIEFLETDNKKIDESVYERVRLFHTDSVLCGISALAERTNAPNLLRKEAIKQYSINPSVEAGSGPDFKLYKSKVSNNLSSIPSIKDSFNFFNSVLGQKYGRILKNLLLLIVRPSESGTPMVQSSVTTLILQDTMLVNLDITTSTQWSSQHAKIILNTMVRTPLRQCFCLMKLEVDCAKFSV